MVWEILYEYVLPSFLIALMGAVLLLAKPITSAISKWLEQRGVIVEESRQRMFQTALENAARTVIRRSGGGVITDMLLDHGVRHMHEGAQDQIEHFGATDDQIKRRVADRVDAKLREQSVRPETLRGLISSVPSAPVFSGRSSGSSEVRL